MRCPIIRSYYPDGRLQPHCRCSLPSTSLWLLASHSHHSSSLLCSPFNLLTRSSLLYPPLSKWHISRRLYLYELIPHIQVDPHNRRNIGHSFTDFPGCVAMVFWVYPGGHDLQHRINLDSLGQLYLAFATTWTSLLLCGMTFLVRNRKLPFLRIRRLPLGILAVCTLHVYWCLCMLAYILNGYFPCSTEYWIMSTYLPVGIALYQANNTQLLHVAGFQQDLANPKAFPAQHQRTAPARGWRSLVVRWKSYSATKRATTCIKIGIIAQVSWTLPSQRPSILCELTGR